jgi:hypothetical protein
MVIDASAMLVATTTLRAPGGAYSKIFYCISVGRAEYTGSIISSGASAPSFFILSYNTWQAVSISSCPVRNSRISPAGSSKWIYMQHIRAASR